MTARPSERPHRDRHPSHRRAVNRRSTRRACDSPPSARAAAKRPAVRNVPYQWVLRRQFIGVYLDRTTPATTRAVRKAAPAGNRAGRAPGAGRIAQQPGGGDERPPDRLRCAGDRRAVAMARRADARALRQAHPFPRAYASPYGPRRRPARHSRRGRRDASRRPTGGRALPPRARCAGHAQLALPARSYHMVPILEVPRATSCPTRRDARLSST